MGRGCCRLDRCQSETRKEWRTTCIAKQISRVILQNCNYASTGWELGDIGLVILVTFVCIMCYCNSLGGEFVHDDIVAITTNPDVLGHSSIKQLFLNDFWGKPMADPNSHKSYRPLTILTFRLNMILSGPSSTSFHVSNLVLHACVVILLIMLCRNVLEWDRHRSFTVALLFATHPIHTEAVSSIVGRAELLSAILFFASFLSFCKSKEDNESSLWFIFSLACAMLALLAKEQGITVLPLCAGYHWMCKYHRKKFDTEENANRFCKQDFKLLIICTVFVCLIAFRFWIMNGAMPSFSEQDNPASFSPFLFTRFLTHAYLAAFNVWLLLAPITLSYDWQMDSIPLVESFWDPRNLPTAFLYLTVFALTIRVLLVPKNSDSKILYIGLGIIIFTYIPASNLFFTVGFVVAERILYLPSAGFCLLITCGLYKLKQEFPKYFCMWKYLTFILIVFFFVRTVRRNQDWISREALFTSGIHTVPNNAKIHYNYANLQKDQGNTDLAIRHYKIAISLRPDHASAHNNLATLLTNESQAERHYRSALSINPTHSKALYNLATLYRKNGKLRDASMLLQDVLKLEEGFTEAYSSLAIVKEELNEFEDAEKLHLKLLGIQPNNADFLNNYGAFLQNRGRIEDAVEQYLKAVRKNANHTVALVNAARTLKSLKHTNEAENLYKRALSIQDDAKVMDNLGMLYLSTGRIKEANFIYQKLHQKYPNYIDGKIHYAQLLLHQRSYSEAEKLLLLLSEAENRNREVYHQLAILYSHTNQTAEALDYILKALTLCSADDRSCASLHAEHADILKDINDMDAAVKSYQMAIQLNPKLSHAHINLAVIKHLQGKCQQALRHYHEAYLLEPDNQLLLDNMAKLHRQYSSMCPMPLATMCKSR